MKKRNTRGPGAGQSQATGKRKTKMANKVSVKNIEVSMSNLKAWVETGLRQLGEINDSQNVKLLTFAVSADHTKVIEWEGKKVIPIQLMLVEDKEVEVIIYK